MLVLAVRHGPQVRPAKHVTIQVKYTNPSGPKDLTKVLSFRYGADDLGNTGFRERAGNVMLLVRMNGELFQLLSLAASLSSSGSNQAREGRLVDALAARGDEGRDTLR